MLQRLFIALIVSALVVFASYVQAASDVSKETIDPLEETGPNFNNWRELPNPLPANFNECVVAVHPQARFDLGDGDDEWQIIIGPGDVEVRFPKGTPDRVIDSMMSHWYRNKRGPFDDGDPLGVIEFFYPPLDDSDRRVIDAMIRSGVSTLEFCSNARV